MSEFTPEQPEGTLVEPEGVNAGSSVAADSASPPHGDGLLDGDGTADGRLTDGTVPGADRGPGGTDDELLGAPETDPQAPGQHAAPPGQDSGSAG
jgi:hypothetical protein